MSYESEDFIQNNIREEVLQKICWICESEKLSSQCPVHLKIGDVVLSYKEFKLIAHDRTYDLLVKHIVSQVYKSLEKYHTFRLHVLLANYYVKEIDHHRSFIEKIANELKKIPYIEICYIHQAPFFFRQILKFIMNFLPQEVLKKIQIIKSTLMSDN
jgi:hypothetical protein